MQHWVPGKNSVSLGTETSMLVPWTFRTFWLRVGPTGLSSLLLSRAPALNHMVSSVGQARYLLCTSFTTLPEQDFCPQQSPRGAPRTLAGGSAYVQELFSWAYVGSRECCLNRRYLRGAGGCTSCIGDSALWFWAAQCGSSTPLCEDPCRSRSRSLPLITPLGEQRNRPDSPPQLLQEPVTHLQRDSRVDGTWVREQKGPGSDHGGSGQIGGDSAPGNSPSTDSR